MLDFVKTTDLVKDELNHELYLLEILKEDLVNVSALAKKLLPKIKSKNPKATVESISMAVKRFVTEEKGQKVSGQVREIIANSQILTRNDIVHMTFERNDFISLKISEISKKIKWNQEEVFFVNQGAGEVTVILDEKNKILLDDCRKFLIETTSHLAVLSIKDLVSKSIKVPGIYAYFINQLARKSINIVEVVSTWSQITLVVNRNDLTRTYEIIEKSINFYRNK